MYDTCINLTAQWFVAVSVPLQREVSHTKPFSKPLESKAKQDFLADVNTGREVTSRFALDFDEVSDHAIDIM